jgi:predicted dehydrogenase
MSSITRRSFLEHTLAVSAAGLAASQLATAQEVPNKPDAQSTGRTSANDKIGVAVIGLHGRGLDHLRGYGGEAGAEVVAICDVDPSTFDKAQQTLAQRGRQPAKTYGDLRKMLESPEVQAVSIAMPNHWHALAAYWAMAAGKDVYVEKPVSHNIHEGRILEQARVKFDRICQAGTQARSSSAHREAIAYIREGHIGKVMLARGLCYKKRDSIGHFEDSSPPSGVDYDLWLGPAPVRPFNKNRFHYNWHWNWDYGNGDIGNQGVHQMDIARWALGREMAASAISVGGRFGYEDDGQTPNTMVTLMETGETPLIFEVRGLKTPPLTGVTVGNIIYGTEGFVAFGEEDSSSAVAFDNSGKRVKAFKGSGNHFNNFLSAVRSRKQADLNCPILEGHLSSTLCHLANISYRMGAAHPFDLPPRAFGDAMDMYEAFGRFEQHLADNALSMRELSFKLGPRIAFDSRSEKFGGHSEANAFLSREYRAPYVVPEKIA